MINAWLLAAFFVLIWPSSVDSQPLQIDRHSGIYEPAGRRTVIFGGYDGSPLGDVWTLSLDSGPRWDLLAPLGFAPAARFGHSAIHVPAGNRMIVFGGSTGAATNEVWELSLADPATWSQPLTFGTPPSARLYHSAIYDPMRDCMWVFGGTDGLFTRHNDVWTLLLGDTMRWNQVVPTGTPPSRRLDQSAIYDPLRDRMIVFGGEPRFDGVWQLSLADTMWSMIVAAGDAPARRNGHSATYDPLADRMILFGGTDGNQPLNDAWALSLAAPSTWTALDAAGGPPTPRASHIAVHDPTHQAMVVVGGFPYSDDRTWALSFGSTPAWSPAKQQIALSSDDLQFPIVTIGDTVAVSFTMANAGLEALDITAIQLPSSDMTISVTPPFALAWRDELDPVLTLAARLPRTTQDSLVIESNDPDVPNKRVALGIDVRGLDFQSRVLDDPPQVPLGTSFVVVVTPEPAVRIERGTLFYRVAETAGPFDSLAFTPLATDFIATIPASAVTERGVDYYVEVHNSAFRSVQPPGAPNDSLFHQSVAAAMAFVAVPRPTSGSQYLEGRDIEVEIVLPDGAAAVAGRIHYREGGAASSASDTLAGGILGRPIATIPAHVVGARGVEYWVEVETDRSDLRFPANDAETAIIRTRVQNLAEPLQHGGVRYRMLSVPLDFGADFSGSLDDLLTDQLGTYDPIRWRAFRYAPDSLRNLEFSPSRAAFFRPEPGRAFWLISLDAHRVDTKPIEGLSTDTVQPHPIALAPGWNQFGNPFSFPVAWADVIRDTTKVLAPVAFDPAMGTTGGYSNGSPSVLVPFEGYFIENVGAVAETLWVPPRAVEMAASPTETAPTPASMNRPGPGGVQRNATPHPSAVEHWQLRLGATTDDASDAANDFGVHPLADDAHDANDLREPPVAPGPWVHLAFANRWSEWPGMYRRDLRSRAAGHTWDVELRSGTRGEAVSLDFASLGDLPSDFAVRIVDRELGNVVGIDLAPRRAPEPGPAAEAARTHYQLVSLGPDHPYRLAIVAGSRDYVARAGDEARLVPARLTLFPSAPNPFRFATQIRFGLPRAAEVAVEVFSVMGERIATLQDRALIEAGLHAVVWDGRRSSGTRAPSGVYLVRVIADQDVQSMRLVLVR